jgi:hypothetical protein
MDNPEFVVNEISDQVQVLKLMWGQMDFRSSLHFSQDSIQLVAISDEGLLKVWTKTII